MRDKRGRDGALSLPLLSLFLSSIFSYLLSKTMGCFLGCLMSSASIQKLFCGIYSGFKCSFDEFVEEKMFSSSYSSAILAPPPLLCFSLLFFSHLFLRPPQTAILHFFSMGMVLIPVSCTVS